MNDRTGAVVVTGASTGIGRACALHLERRGRRVFAGVRREADARALRDAGSERLTPLLLDVTDAGAIAEASREVEATLAGAPLAGLVNNAGVVVAGSLEFLPLDEMRRQLEVNVTGQLAVTQAFLPMLRGSRGRIVFMGSVSGLFSTPFLGPYCASKFALEAMVDALRVELRPWGIEVSLIEPGAVATPIWDKSADRAGELEKRLPPEARELYGANMQRVRSASQRFKREAMAVETAVAAVDHALGAARPKTRYLLGRDARIQKILARWVPDRWRDRLIVKELKLEG